jgi:hypothetical protein
MGNYVINQRARQSLEHLAWIVTEKSECKKMFNQKK